MIDNRIVSVNTPSIVESRTEVVTKSGTRSYSIAIMAARIAVGIAACKIPIFFSSSPNGKMNAKPNASNGANSNRRPHAIQVSTFNSNFWTLDS